MMIRAESSPAAPVFLVSCSPRKGGNGDSISSLISSALPGKVRVKRVADENVRPCISCGFCAEHPGACALDDPKDGAMSLFRDLCRARVGVIVSPVYFYHLPAQAKAWVDRAQCFWAGESRPGAGQPVTAVLYGARLRGEKLFEGAERTLRYMALSLGLSWTEPLRLYGLDGPQDLAQNPEAQELVRAFALSLRERAGL